MQRIDLNDLAHFDDEKINSVVIANGPETCLLLLCLHAGQQVAEHSAAGSTTVQAITGCAAFYGGQEACEMFAGTLVSLDAGRPYRVVAHTDAVLLVTTVKKSRAAVRIGEAHTGEREIDLCLMPRAERHPLVFDAFDGLAMGESLVVINDHDPHPLRMQIAQLREGEMGWEYIERGPETFRVRVTRVAPPAGRRGAVSTGTAEQPVTIG